MAPAYVGRPSGQCSEIKVREDNIEPRQERCVVELGAAHCATHANRHAQIETVEPLHAVAVGQAVVDRLMIVMASSMACTGASARC